MTISGDFSSYHASEARVAVSTDKALGGTAGHLAEAIPEDCTHIALIPEGTGVRFNIGAAATSSTSVLPVGGIVFNGTAAALTGIHLYAAAAVNVGVFMGGISLRSFLASSLSTGDISIGNVGLLNLSEAEINPAGGQASNVAAAAADHLTACGLVRKDTRALPEAVADGDWVAAQGTATGELRVHDHSLAGGGLTFSRVSILTAGAGTTELLAKAASATQRLHGLYITLSAAALVEIEDKDGVVLATWNIGTNGGIVIPFSPFADGAIQAAAVNKGLQIVNSAGNLGGYAIVSTGV